MTQEAALNIIKSGHNIFLTGPPGAGKTYVLNQYIDHLRKHGVEVAITAPTGIAASHLGGMTIHSFFGLGIKDKLNQYDLENLTEKKYLWDRMKELKVLVIDEVSMLSPDMFRSIDAILKTFKFSQEPFGGIQVIFTGDFFQLPPISNNSEERFIFQTSLWQNMDLHICYLEGSHRHEDEILLNILNEIRNNEVSEESMEHFRSRYKKKTLIDGPVTKLYTHNRDVNNINIQALNDLDTQAEIFKAHSTGQKKWVERIYSSSLVLETISLKKDALVFFIKNNYEEGYINGTLGTVIDFDSFNNPIVETVEGKEITAKRVSWTYTDSDGKVRAEVKQIPLRLAWAITIHKSQGMTLDAAQIDLSSAFEPGQGYVALSRIRSLEGLTLMGLNDVALSIDPQVRDVDQSMRKHSEELFQQEEQRDEEQQTEDHQNFLKRIGGDSSKPTTKKTSSTYEETKKLLLKKMSIEEIAQERGLKENTIAQHIKAITEQDVEIDISHLQPKNEIIERVAQAVVELLKDSDNLDQQGSVKLKPIFEYLNKDISYEDIRLALLFI